MRGFGLALCFSFHTVSLNKLNSKLEIHEFMGLARRSLREFVPGPNRCSPSRGAQWFAILFGVACLLFPGHVSAQGQQNCREPASVTVDFSGPASTFHVSKQLDSSQGSPVFLPCSFDPSLPLLHFGFLGTSGPPYSIDGTLTYGGVVQPLYFSGFAASIDSTKTNVFGTLYWIDPKAPNDPYPLSTNFVCQGAPVEPSGNGVTLWLNCGGNGTATIKISWKSMTIPSPTDLKATQIGNDGTKIQLSWNYGSDPIDGFIIERATPSGAYNDEWSPLLVDVPSGAHSYGDNSVPTAFAAYLYRIRAYKDGGNGKIYSDYSIEARCFQIQWTAEACTVSNTIPPVVECLPITLNFLPSQSYGTRLVGQFTPEPGKPLSVVAGYLDYDHFNWLQQILQCEQCLISPYLDGLGRRLTPPFLDPPLYGYGAPIFQNSDPLVFYWDETSCCDSEYYLYGQGAGGDQSISDTAYFKDLPFDPQLLPGYPTGFVTHLVGVHSKLGESPERYEELGNDLLWYSNFNGTSGSISRSFFNLNPTTSPGIGGTFNMKIVQPEDLPVALREQLIQTGVLNLSDVAKVDHDAPMTAILPSGPQGTNGWYTGPVQVTLIATDIDGASDIAATYYNVDGGATQTYGGPFMVSGNGNRVITYWSVDQAGNVETPPPSISINIAIPLPGDLNGDGKVDCADLAIVRASFGKKIGQIGFDPRADTNNDGIVNIRDLAFVSQHLPAGTVCK